MDGKENKKGRGLVPTENYSRSSIVLKYLIATIYIAPRRKVRRRDMNPRTCERSRRSVTPAKATPRRYSISIQIYSSHQTPPKLPFLHPRVLFIMFFVLPCGVRLIAESGGGFRVVRPFRAPAAVTTSFPATLQASTKVSPAPFETSRVPCPRLSLSKFRHVRYTPPPPPHTHIHTHTVRDLYDRVFIASLSLSY